MENADRYIEEFEEETGWHPAGVGFFAGALLYTQYSFLKTRTYEENHQGQGFS